jgi:hypothetical protein
MSLFGAAATGEPKSEIHLRPRKYDSSSIDRIHLPPGVRIPQLERKPERPAHRSLPRSAASMSLARDTRGPAPVTATRTESWRTARRRRRPTRNARSAGDGVIAFKGVRYAATPFGANRLRPPQLVEPWDGLRDALAFGPKSPQVAYPSGIAEGIPELVGQGEDCLTLNIWTPDVESRPAP